MIMSDEEKKQLRAWLDALRRKAAEGDADFGAEWLDGDHEGNKRGADDPWAEAKSIYRKHFLDVFGDQPYPQRKTGARHTRRTTARTTRRRTNHRGTSGKTRSASQ